MFSTEKEHATSGKEQSVGGSSRGLWRSLPGTGLYWHNSSKQCLTRHATDKCIYHHIYHHIYGIYKITMGSLLEWPMFGKQWATSGSNSGHTWPFQQTFRIVSSILTNMFDQLSCVSFAQKWMGHYLQKLRKKAYSFHPLYIIFGEEQLIVDNFMQLWFLPEKIAS
jgi:hypothetical protein